MCINEHEKNAKRECGQKKPENLSFVFNHHVFFVLVTLVAELFIFTSNRRMY